MFPRKLLFLSSWISWLLWVITHRIISSGSHWIKMITWYQIGRCLSRYPPSDLISVVWFYFDGIKVNKRASVQAKFLIILLVLENKRILFAEASDGEIKEPLENSTQRNMEKSTKCAGTMNMHSPWEIIWRAINPFLACWYIGP